MAAAIIPDYIDDFVARRSRRAPASSRSSRRSLARIWRFYRRGHNFLSISFVDRRVRRSRACGCKRCRREVQPPTAPRHDVIQERCTSRLPARYRISRIDARHGGRQKGGRDPSGSPRPMPARDPARWLHIHIFSQRRKKYFDLETGILAAALPDPASIPDIVVVPGSTA